jgi:hypothetical protein
MVIFFSLEYIQGLSGLLLHPLMSKKCRVSGILISSALTLFHRFFVCGVTIRNSNGLEAEERN